MRRTYFRTPSGQGRLRVCDFRLGSAAWHVTSGHVISYHITSVALPRSTSANMAWAVLIYYSLKRTLEIAPIFTILFSKSVTTGIVPSDWRTVHVSPVYKKGQNYNPENYRPISLTCICCKLLEHLIVKHIMSHADTHNILYPLQHGFRTGRSCETQLREFIDDVTLNMENGKQTDILVLDFSKAFDKVSHPLLLHKLHNYGIQRELNSWIQNFLSNRKQAVVLKGDKSDYVAVESGVPRGSVLGPSLFLYYINDINDIPTGLSSTIRLFADDTIACLAIKSNRDALTLQQDLDKLSNWEKN